MMKKYLIIVLNEDNTYDGIHSLHLWDTTEEAIKEIEKCRMDDLVMGCFYKYIIESIYSE